MLCSEKELGLADESAGIMVLPADLRLAAHRLSDLIHEKLTGHVATGTERSIERANSVELGRAPRSGPFIQRPSAV